MRLIEYNSNESLTPKNIESILLRFGILLAEEVRIAGDGYAFVNPQEVFAVKKIEDKIIFTLTMGGGNELSPEEQTIEIEKQLNFVKTMKRMKHPLPAQIVIQKKYERGMEVAYQNTLNFLTQGAKVSGLQILNEFCNEDDLLIPYFTHMMEENAEDEKGGQYKMTNLLQFKFDLGEWQEEKAIPPLIGVSGQIFGEGFRKNRKWVTSDDKDAKALNIMYTEPLCLMPNLNILLASELKSIRVQLLPITEKWNQLLNQWIEKAIHNQPDSVDFFVKEIMPVNAQLKELIENNEYIKNTYKLQPQLQIELMIGEVPIYELWEFYEHMNLLKPESFEILKALKAEGKFNYRIPFISFQHVSNDGDETNFSVPTEQENIIKPTKKSLNID